MASARRAAAALSLMGLLLGGCASSRSGRGAAPDEWFYDLQARLAARGATLVSRRGEFRVGSERFNPDCTGFVQAVYEAEGIPLRALMRLAAPQERRGVVAAYRAIQAYGAVFGGGGAWPAPGDLVFWRDTYDRNRNGRADDGLTHVGIVESVANGTVVFLHRGATGVARGAMTLERPAEARADGVLLNSAIRTKGARARGAPVLAGALFAGYGRIDSAKLPPGVEVEGRRPASP